MVKTVFHPEVLPPPLNWLVHLQMYPFMFLCVVMFCEVCVVMFCPCQTVVMSFWKWCMHDCVILEGVIFLVCVVCVCVCVCDVCCVALV